MQTGFQATKDLGDPAGIFMGEREYFFLHSGTIPPRLSASSVSLFLLGTLANSQGHVDFAMRVVGWFTPVFLC